MLTGGSLSFALAKRMMNKLTFQLKHAILLEQVLKTNTLTFIHICFPEKHNVFQFKNPF